MSDTNHEYRRSRTRSIISLVASLLMVVIALLILMNRERIYDFYVVQSFTPSQQVSSYIDSTGMSSEGRFYYLASKPSIEDAESFNTHCTNTESGSAVLGCYTNRKIYIYDVNNAELAGIKDVTAAHEMMHAVYDRFSASQKSRVDSLVESEYQARKNDPQLATRVALYDKLEPGQRAEELYAIFATEATNVNAELEQHYMAYFADRHKVTTLYRQYSNVFLTLESRANELSDKLKQLEASITSQKSDYDAQSTQLTNDISSFNTRAQAGSFTSEDVFYAERSRLVARSNQLDNLRTQINTQIDEYTKLRDELTSISTRVTQLNSSIDSKIKQGPKL